MIDAFLSLRFFNFFQKSHLSILDNPSIYLILIKNKKVLAT